MISANITTSLAIDTNDSVHGEVYDKQGMIAAIREQFKISWHGIHGANHWARVLHHGMTIGSERGADLLVVELFAFLHYSQRFSDGGDHFHGKRGAEYARSLNTTYFELTPPRIDALCEAIEHHSGGKVHDQATIQTCWDADRLDLGRVSIMPSPKFLSEEATKHITRAYRWSREGRKRVGDATPTSQFSIGANISDLSPAALN